MDITTHLTVIGTNIKIIRGNMKQQDLAKKAGVSRSTLSNIENGKSIELDNLLRIAKALNVHPNDLFLTEEDKHAFNFKSKKIIDKLYDLLAKIK